MSKSFYWIFKWFIRQMLRLYFGDIERVNASNIPAGPKLLAPNHQNAFLDALLVGAFTPGVHYYLTRSDVFHPLAHWFFRGLHMIPIYRIRDGFGKLEKNQQTFAACYDRLRLGESVMLFPEGNHGEHHFLRPLTKGLARIALGSQVPDLKVVPIGLNYFDHRNPRRKVMIVYGAPIQVPMEAISQSALKSITSQVSEGIKQCLVIPEPTDEPKALAKRVFDLKNESLSFQELKTHAFATPANRYITPWVSLFECLLSVPNLPAFFVLRWVLSRFKDRVFWGSMKFATMIVVLPLWWTLSTWVLLMLCSAISAAAFLLTAIITLYVRAWWRNYFSISSRNSSRS